MKSIELKIENQIAFISLNRPDVFNSFNREMAFLMQDTLDICGNDNNVRAIVITGNGKAFCAGQDIGEITNPELNPVLLLAYLLMLQPFLKLHHRNFQLENI